MAKKVVKPADATNTPAAKKTNKSAAKKNTPAATKAAIQTNIYP